jgi:N-acetylneuraminate synthase/sialic acid synthase
MSPEIRVKDHVISEETPCFVVAEIGHNHQGNLQTAKRLIEEAKECGAQAVKLQKRNNKLLFTEELYNRPYDNEESFGPTYGEHREFLEFGEEEYKELIAYARELNIILFATAFDIDSLEFLSKLDMPAIKFASGDLHSHWLLQEAAKLGKPIFLSTGAASLDEVREAYGAVKKFNDQICIMQCTAAYPAWPQDIHLNVIRTYRKEFPEAMIGYSGHDSGIVLPVVAYVLGARVVEKHFTLNRAFKGTDHRFSLEPVGLRKMIRDLRRAAEAFGSYDKRYLEDIESEARLKMGKSIVLREGLDKGSVLTRDYLCFKSPCQGILPSQIEQVLGKRLKVDLAKETHLLWEHLENED